MAMKQIAYFLIISCYILLFQTFDKNYGLIMAQSKNNVSKVQASSAINENECDKYVSDEMKKVSLENISDIYLKKVLQGFYLTIKEDSAESKNYKNITINTPIIDASSILYFKIDKGFAKGYEIKITGKDFDKSKHLINPPNYCKIDNQVVWGTDGDLPTEEIDSFYIKYFGSEIKVPKKDYCNLYEPLRYGGGIYHGCILADDYKKYVIFILFGSDGAGSYTAYFIFKDGKYLMRKINKSDC
jgi:hypothetical protein